MSKRGNLILGANILAFVFSGIMHLMHSKGTSIPSVFLWYAISTVFLMAWIYSGYLIYLERSEEKEREKEAGFEDNISRFEALVKHSTNIIIIGKLDSSIDYINPNGLKALGFNSLEEVRSKHLVDLRSAAGKKNLQTAIDEVTKTGHWEGETEYQNLVTGAIFPVTVTAFLIRDKRKRPSLFAAIARNISEEHKLNLELQKTISLLLATFDSSADGILAVDKTGKIINYNNLFAEMWNIPKELLETKNDEAAVSHVLSQLAEPQKFEEKIQHLYSHPTEDSYDLIYFKDGKVFERFSRPQKLKGEIIGRVWTFRDITEKQKLDTKIKKASDEIYDLYNNAPCGYYSVDHQHLITNINNTALSWLGYERGELIGKPVWNTLVIDQGMENTDLRRDEFMKAGHAHSREFEFIRKDGSLMPTLLNADAIKDKSGNLIQINVTIFNITDRKKNEEELLKAKKIAEESLKFRELFLANMSHEIRTPISGISGLIELLRTTSMDQEQFEFLDAMKSSADNLLIIINDILDVSKLQAGKMEFEQVEFNLKELVQDAVRIQMPKAKEKNLAIFIHLDASIPQKLSGDSFRLNQILLNLINNGIKFTEKGMITLEVKIIDETANAIRLLFSVTDTGIGIPKDKLESIFESFTQAGKETSRKYGGTGLGLAIVKKLVEMQGGSIHVSSEPDKGSVFTFDLPFQKNMNQETHSVPKIIQEKPEEYQAIKGTALIAEDHPVNQLLVKKLLDRWGMDYDLAEDGKAAVEMARKKNYDIILMDIQMPDMDGYEATTYIRTRFPYPENTIPILAMTAYASVEEKEKCLAAGMNDYLSKPFKAPELFSKIIQEIGQTHLVKRDSSIYSEKEKETFTSGKGTVTDLGYLHELADGSIEFVTDMLKVFLEQTPGSLIRLRKNMDEKNWEEIAIIAHRMKPGIGFVGIKRLENTLDKIEEFGEKKINLQQLPYLVKEVEEICMAAMGELKAELLKLS